MRRSRWCWRFNWLCRWTQKRCPHSFLFSVVALRALPVPLPGRWPTTPFSVIINLSAIESFIKATAQSSVHQTPQIFSVVKHVSGLWPHGRILSGAPQTISFVCSVVPLILSLESQRLKVVSFRIVAPTWWTPALSEGSPQAYLTQSSSTLVL